MRNKYIKKVRENKYCTIYSNKKYTIKIFDDFVTIQNLVHNGKYIICHTTGNITVYNDNDNTDIDGKNLVNLR